MFFFFFKGQKWANECIRPLLSLTLQFQVGTSFIIGDCHAGNKRQRTAQSSGTAPVSQCHNMGRRVLRQALNILYNEARCATAAVFVWPDAITTSPHQPSQTHTVLVNWLWLWQLYCETKQNLLKHKPDQDFEFYFQWLLSDIHFLPLSIKFYFSKMVIFFAMSEKRLHSPTIL